MATFSQSDSHYTKTDQTYAKFGAQWGGVKLADWAEIWCDASVFSFVTGF